MTIYDTINSELRRYDDLSITEKNSETVIVKSNDNPLDVTVTTKNDRFLVKGIDSMNDKVAYELTSESDVKSWFQMRPWF